MIKKTKTEFAQWAEDIAGPMVIDDDTGLPHEELKPYLYSIKVGLQRFINAQNSHDTYQNAVKEIRNGKKESHWMWYIFPQMIGLGKSEKSKFYGLTREEAKEYMEHPILSKRLIEATEAVLNNPKPAYEIFGYDVIKFRSCMLLFASVSDEPVFKKVLVKYGWK